MSNRKHVFEQLVLNIASVSSVALTEAVHWVMWVDERCCMLNVGIGYRRNVTVISVRRLRLDCPTLVLPETMYSSTRDCSTSRGSVLLVADFCTFCCNALLTLLAWYAEQGLWNGTASVCLSVSAEAAAANFAASSAAVALPAGPKFPAVASLAGDIDRLLHWLGGRKGIRPVKNWVVGCWRGYLSEARCRLAHGHCHSLSLASAKSRLVLPFWYWLTRVVLDKGLLNRCVCVLHGIQQCSVWQANAGSATLSAYVVANFRLVSVCAEVCN